MEVNMNWYLWVVGGGILLAFVGYRLWQMRGDFKGIKEDARKKIEEALTSSRK
jgi:hypothetical protein